jgi:uncharacterized protein
VVASVETVPIIDVDTHVSEPPDLWTARLPREWQELAPRVEWDDTTSEYRWQIGDRLLAGVGQSSMAGWPEYFPSYPRSLDDADPACYDPHARLARMDEYGVTANVLYSNMWGFDSHVFLEHGPDYAMACLRAYNDFLTEFAAADPDRLVPLTSLPFWDLEAAITELRRCVELGHKGVVLAAEYRLIGYPNVTEPDWGPVLAAAQDLELSVNFHIGFSRKAAASVQQAGEKARSGLGVRGIDRAEYVRMVTPGHLYNAQAIADVIITGLCDRYPRLKFVSVESGVGWVPFLLEALDWQWQASGAFKDYPERLMPSEYFRRQVFMTYWFERLNPDVLTAYADNIMFETDFPHPVSMSPGPASPAIPAREFVRQTMSGVDPIVVNKVLHDNAARLYHLK